MANRLTGQCRGTEQVVSRVTGVEHHTAQGEVTVLYLTLPDGVSRDARVCAVHHWMELKHIELITLYHC